VFVVAIGVLNRADLCGRLIFPAVGDVFSDQVFLFFFFCLFFSRTLTHSVLMSQRSYCHNGFISPCNKTVATWGDLGLLKIKIFLGLFVDDKLWLVKQA
jgi:hypothetical protein